MSQEPTQVVPPFELDVVDLIRQTKRALKAAAKNVALCRRRAKDCLDKSDLRIFNSVAGDAHFNAIAENFALTNLLLCLRILRGVHLRSCAPDKWTHQELGMALRKEKTWGTGNDPRRDIRVRREWLGVPPRTERSLADIAVQELTRRQRVRKARWLEQKKADQAEGKAP